MATSPGHFPYTLECEGIHSQDHPLTRRTGVPRSA